MIILEDLMNIMWNEPSVKVKLYGEIEPCTYESIDDIDDYWSYTVISVQVYEHSIEIELEEQL